MAAQFQPVRSDQGGFNIKEFFFKYLRFIPLFIFSLILSYTAAFLYLRYSTPIYKSTSSLILKDDRGPGGGGDPKFQQLFVDDRTKNIQNEIDYLKSRPLLERVVEALNLNVSYYAKGKIKQENVYKKAPFYIDILQLKDSASSFHLKIKFKSENSFQVNNEKALYGYGEAFSTPNGSFRLRRISSGMPNDEYTVAWAPTGVVAGNIIPTLTVAPKLGGSGLVFSIEGDNAQMISDILNQLMKEYQKSTIEDKNTTTLQTIDFVNGRLKVVSRELDSITRQRIAYQVANNISNAEGAQTALYAKTDAANTSVIEAEEKLRNLDQINEYLNSNNRFTPVPSVLGVADPTLGGLMGAYNMAQQERKSMLNSNIPEDNPRIKLKEEEIEKLRRSILENLRNLRQVNATALNEIRRRNSQTQYQLQTMPAKQQALLEMMKQEQGKQALYTFLNEKLEESSISLAATISNIKVLEKAMPNNTPIKPNRASIQSIALLIGLIIPALFVFLLEVLDDKINSRADIEKSTPVTILGEVGHAPDENTLVVTAKSRGFVAEQFRIIRSNLQYVLANIPKPVILVTSSFSGEGKSFVSTNLGAVQALAGKKTVILEFDIRKPKILSGLNMPKRPGLTNYILGKIGVEELAIPVPGNENLYVLPCGPVPPNPAELLLDPKFVTLFDYLRQHFDAIVMDTAPIGMVSDALTLSQFADCSIYIVRQGVTHKKQLELVHELQEEGKLPKVNIILNDIKLRAGYGYYGYGRYGYGQKYGYGYGYFEDAQAEQTFLQRLFGKNGKATTKPKKQSV